MSVQLSVVRRLRRRRPNLSGDLGQLLSEAPCFRRRLAGYDRLQVDNYVSWAEAELQLAGREVDELAARLGRCTAELQRAQQRLSTSPAGWELGQVSERVGEILRLAADEAADLVESGVAEAERLREQGAAAAAAALHQASDVRARAAADADRLQDQAEAARQAAEDQLARARELAAALVHVASVQCQEASAEAARTRRTAEREHEAAQAELTVARSRRAQTELVVDRLSGELETALGELTPAPNVLAVVPDDPIVLSAS